MSETTEHDPQIETTAQAPAADVTPGGEVSVAQAPETVAVEASGALPKPENAAKSGKKDVAAAKADKKDSDKDKEKDKKEEHPFPFAITVGQVYDGPLDLLLDLVRKQDIDIYDIPIAKITMQFLHYVERMKQMDVDVAADFIYTASLLIHIKSKTLLPRDPDQSAEAQVDPRDELVQRLLEHERFKAAAQLLQQKQQLEEAVLSNPAIREFRNAEGTEPELAVEVIDLVRIFHEILDRMKNRPMIRVNEETVTVAQMIEYMRRRLVMEERPLRLKRLLQTMQSQNALICSFLAILELVRLQAILLRQDTIFGDILIKKHEKFDSVLGEAADVRDDWK